MFNGGDGTSRVTESLEFLKLNKLVEASLSGGVFKGLQTEVILADKGRRVGVKKLNWSIDLRGEVGRFSALFS